MKKLNYLLGFALLLFIVAAGMTFGASTWTVNPLGGADFTTIQAAINSPLVLAGDTINVAAGNYPEQLIIKKPLTLVGTDGAILNGATLGSQKVGVCVKSGNVTFDNIDVVNFSGNGIIVGYEASIPGSLPNVHIKNCKVGNVQPGYSHGFGIYVGYQSEDFKRPAASPKLTAHLDYSGLLIDNNEITDTFCSGLVLQSISGTPGTLIIRNNYVHDITTNDGIWIDCARNLLVEGNVVANNVCGIDLTSYGDAYIAGSNWQYDWSPHLNGPFGPSDNIIRGNQVTNNQYDGVAVYDGYPATITVAQNCITGNISGAANYLSEPFDAANNWWGDASGPNHPVLNPTGAGNAATDNVNFTPWLSGISYTGDPVFATTVPVILKATVATSGGPVAGISVEFWVDGYFIWEATTDTNGVAEYNWGLKSATAYNVVARAAGGCLTATASVNVASSFTITATAGAHGAITPSGAVSVDAGQNQAFSIAANLGWHIADVLVDGSSIGAASSYTFSNVIAGHTISATFAINTYALTVTAVNGTVAKVPDQPLYNHGTHVTLTATPALGYHFVNWTGSVSSTANPLDVLMDGPKTVTANFAYYPFASFFVDEAKIDWKKKADDDKIMVKGSFILPLPPASDGVKPGELVTIVVGKFSQSIVMEEKVKGNKWEFKRDKGDRGIKDAKIEFKKNEITFEFHIDKEDLDALAPWTNPMTISLRIGDDMGFGSFLFDQKKDKWEYHK